MNKKMYEQLKSSEKELTGYPHIDKPWMQYYDADLVSKPEPQMNITDYLKSKTAGLDSIDEGYYYGKKISYGEFWNNVDNASKVLNDLGMKKQDVVMNLVSNIPESGQIWLGASQLGLISDFIDPRPDSMDFKANAQKVLDLVKREKAKYIVALDTCYLFMLKPIEKELKEFGVEKIITLSASDSMNLVAKIDYLKDAIVYNKLKTASEREKAAKQLNSCKVLLNKLQQMKKFQDSFEKSLINPELEVVKYADLLRDVKYSRFESVYEPNMVNYIGHTSGTSGSRPKPICLTNENHISSNEQLLKAGTEYQVGDKVLHELPFFSPLGADNNYLFNIACGSTNIHVPEFQISDFGYLIKKYHPNVVLGTPSWLSALTKTEYLNKEDLSCITRIIYGGDSMSAADEENLNKWLKNHGSSAIVRKGHGMSEFCGCGSYAKDDYNKLNSIGIPLPNTIYTLVNPDVEDRLEPVKFEQGADRLTGELVVSSKAVTPGKLGDEVIIKHFDLDGQDYIRTRDLVEMDRNGVFYFDSRKDRSFTRFDGYKIKPYEIEKVIESSPLVRYCKIVPYYDETKRGLMPKAHIVLNKNFESQEEIKEITEQLINEQFINNSVMSSRQIPAKIKYREAMPLTANSKINYNGLIQEGIEETDISIVVEETNLSVGAIEIIVPNIKTRTRKE